MPESSRIHISYIIGIPIAVIVALISVRWGSIPDLVDYITFALTCTSIALALVAIVYAFYTNAGSSERLGALTGASRDIQESASTIRRSSADLEARIASIPPLLTEVGAGVERAHAMLAALQNRDPVGLGVDAPLQPAGTIKSPRSVLLASSAIGKLTYYALAVAYQLKVPFDFEAFVAECQPGQFQYIFGWAMASDSLGAIDIRTRHSSTWRVVDYDAALFSEVLAHAEGVLKDQPTDTAWNADNISSVRRFMEAQSKAPGEKHEIT